MTVLRRSERIQQSCSNALASNDNYGGISKHSEDPEQSQDSDANILYASSKARTKRRKVRHAGAENTQEGQIARSQRPDKYVRGRRGYLKLITEIPLDTLHEIFRHLDPLDLLHLSWASKSLHGVTMEKSSIYIWEEAYNKLYESENPPPHCPKDINLAQYTRFLYHQKCMVCNTQSGPYTSWVMRLRACKRCLESDRFSACYDTGYLTINARKSRYALTSDLEEAKQTDNWRERHTLVKDRAEGALNFSFWKLNCLYSRSDDLNQRRNERKTSILKKLGEIGWTEAEIKEINQGRIPSDLPGFGTVKKLTTRDWEGIRPNIERVLSDMKERHLLLMKKERLQSRWRQFNEAFLEWNRVQTLDAAFRPRVVDIVDIEPFFSAIFEADTEVAHFEIDEINRAASEWMTWRDNLVLSALPQDLQVRYQVNKLWRQPLAILWFSRPLNNMLDRICGFRGDLRYNIPQSPNERGTYDAILQLGQDSAPWKWWYEDLKLDTKHFQVTKDILEYLGMDPYTTTIAQVEECKQTFSCVQCKSIVRLRCEQMIAHDKDRHYEEGKERLPLSTRWVLEGNKDGVGRAAA